jgi:hypothetical protein
MKAPGTLAALAALLTAQLAAQVAHAEIPPEFLGMWRLVSYVQRYADGTEQLNPRTAAYITYTDTGHMCFVSMDPNRPLWKSPARPTELESKTALEGFSAYCGAAEVNVREGYVLHHVEIEETPNDVGIVRKRLFTLEGNRLVLRADPSELRPPMVDSVLTWQKIDKAAWAK